MSDLPSFPVDDETLSLLEATMTTFNADGATSLMSTLDLLSGIDPDDQSMFERIDDNTVYDPRPHYTEHTVILALIAEVRRYRRILSDTPEDTP